jgi:peptidoglycan/LPS O-acetylase OafA/YrhL
MNLLLVTTLLLSAAVVIGLYLVIVGLRRNKRIPTLGIAHAALALSGIIVLLGHILGGPLDRLDNTAALFLFFALLGGVLVFSLHEENKGPSIPVVALHAVMGVVGISLLLINLF